MAPRHHVVSYSELYAARQCPLKHELSYVERWSGQPDPLDARAKGTAWHNVMEAHYTVLKAAKLDRGPATLKACRLAAEQQMGELPESLQKLISWMYDGYVDHWGLDPEWEILAVEHQAVCRLPSLRGNSSGFSLKVKIDLVVRNRRNRKIYVVDHKSGKDLPGAKLLELDDQFPLYTWAMRQLGKKVFGQVYNAARTLRLEEDKKDPGKTPLDKRFARVPMIKSDRELDIVAIEAYQTASARYAQQAEVARARAAGLPVMSPRHTDPQRCAWMCDYKEPCMAGRKGLDIRGFLRDMKFEQHFERH